MRYVTIAELSSMIRQNLWKIPHDIDLVVGIPRSGLMVANIVALYLNKRLSDIDSFVEGRVFSCGDHRSSFVDNGPMRKILIVDDSVRSGATINKTKKKLSQYGTKYEFVFFAPIISSQGIANVDYFAEIIDDNRVFEWNLFHHPQINNTCFDIDGVLCCNPIEDDDGEKYIDFIQTAKPLFAPTTHIDTIVTCRLEKYRNNTEAWLRANNIRYNKLIMLNLPNKRSRILWGKHGEFKGEIYKNSSNTLFIESSKCEAKTIAQISGKPVICIETNELITAEGEDEISIKSKIKKMIKTKFPKLYNTAQRTYHVLFNYNKKIYKKISQILHYYLFNQKKCCICGASFNEFLPLGTDAAIWKNLHGVGAGLRKATCPNCWSTDRERLLYFYFKEKYIPHLTGKKIKLLHIAPELNLSAFLMSRSEIEYAAGDKRCEGYSYPDYVIDIDIMDMSNILDNTYDVIICNHVLEHVEDDITAMKEIYRVLKPEGIAILQVPLALDLKETYENPTITTPEGRFNSYGQSNHVRLYGMDYPKRLETAGFSVEVRKNTFRHCKSYGLNRKEKLFICKKMACKTNDNSRWN